MAENPRVPKDPGREAFYAPKPSDEVDDEGELELEPRDPEILAAEERRIREAAEAAEANVDIDEIYREEHRKGDYDFEIGEFRPQFQIKHLFMATAALAVVMAIGQVNPGIAVLVAILSAVGGTLVYLNRKERAEQERREKDRQRRYKRLRELREAQLGSGAVEAQPPLEDVQDLLAAGTTQEPFRLKFSQQEATLALVCTAIVLSLIFVLGPGPAALVLGIVALVGLVFEACGFDAPRMLVLAWWYLLVIYIFVSIIAAIWERVH